MKRILVSCLLFLWPALALADHPADVQRLTSEKEYYEALRIYQHIPKRQLTTDAVIAAGKSAWALSLPQLAINEFEKALQDEQIDESKRASLLLSRGIIEYQEDRFRVAILFAERVIELIKNPSPLRSKAWLLWGESLVSLKSYGAAEDKFVKAAAEATQAELPSIYYSLGNTQFKLGKLDAARVSFEKIPLHDENASYAMRRLAEISLQERKYDQANFWLSRGKRDFPEQFIDSWVDYALVQVAVSKDDEATASKIQADAERKYPPSDTWVTLLNAAVEELHWKNKLAQVK